MKWIRREILGQEEGTARRPAAHHHTGDPDRAIAYEKSGRQFDAEEALFTSKKYTDAGSSPFRYPRSGLTVLLLQEVVSVFNNRKLHMRLPWGSGSGHLTSRRTTLSASLCLPSPGSLLR